MSSSKYGHFQIYIPTYLIIFRRYGLKLHVKFSEPHHFENLHTYPCDELISGWPQTLKIPNFLMKEYFLNFFPVMWLAIFVFLLLYCIFPTKFLDISTNFVREFLILFFLTSKTLFCSWAGSKISSLMTYFAFLGSVACLLCLQYKSGLWMCNL